MASRDCDKGKRPMDANVIPEEVKRLQSNQITCPGSPESSRNNVIPMPVSQATVGRITPRLLLQPQYPRMQSDWVPPLAGPSRQQLWREVPLELPFSLKLKNLEAVANLRPEDELWVTLEELFGPRINHVDGPIVQHLAETASPENIVLPEIALSLGNGDFSVPNLSNARTATVRQFVSSSSSRELLKHHHLPPNPRFCSPVPNEPSKVVQFPGFPKVQREIHEYPFFPERPGLSDNEISQNYPEPADADKNVQMSSRSACEWNSFSRPSLDSSAACARMNQNCQLDQSINTSHSQLGLESEFNRKKSEIIKLMLAEFSKHSSRDILSASLSRQERPPDRSSRGPEAHSSNVPGLNIETGSQPVSQVSVTMANSNAFHKRNEKIEDAKSPMKNVDTKVYVMRDIKEQLNRPGEGQEPEKVTKAYVDSQMAMRFRMEKNSERKQSDKLENEIMEQGDSSKEDMACKFGKSKLSEKLSVTEIGKCKGASSMEVKVKAPQANKSMSNELLKDDYAMGHESLLEDKRELPEAAENKHRMKLSQTDSGGSRKDGSH